MTDLPLSVLRVSWLVVIFLVVGLAAFNPLFLGWKVFELQIQGANTLHFTQ